MLSLFIQFKTDFFISSKLLVARYPEGFLFCKVVHNTYTYDPINAGQRSNIAVV
jgi:hypothetical protein